MYIDIDILNIKNLIMKRKSIILICCSFLFLSLAISSVIFLIHNFGFWSIISPFGLLTLMLIIAFFIVWLYSISFICKFIKEYKFFLYDKGYSDLKEDYIKSMNSVILVSSIISILLIAVSSFIYFNRLESCGISFDDNQKVKFMAELSFKEREELFWKCSAKNENREKVAEVMQKYCAIDDRMYDLENPISLFTKSCIEEINQDISNALLKKADENQLNMLLKKKESLIKDLKQFNL